MCKIRSYEFLCGCARQVRVSKCMAQIKSGKEFVKPEHAEKFKAGLEKAVAELKAACEKIEADNELNEAQKAKEIKYVEKDKLEPFYNAACRGGPDLTILVPVNCGECELEAYHATRKEEDDFEELPTFPYMGRKKKYERPERGLHATSVLKGTQKKGSKLREVYVPEPVEEQEEEEEEEEEDVPDPWDWSDLLSGIGAATGTIGQWSANEFSAEAWQSKKRAAITEGKEKTVKKDKVEKVKAEKSCYEGSSNALSTQPVEVSPV